MVRISQISEFLDISPRRAAMTPTMTRKPQIGDRGHLVPLPNIAADLRQQAERILALNTTTRSERRAIRQSLHDDNLQKLSLALAKVREHLKANVLAHKRVEATELHQRLIELLADASQRDRANFRGLVGAFNGAQGSLDRLDAWTERAREVIAVLEAEPAPRQLGTVDWGKAQAKPHELGRPNTIDAAPRGRAVAHAGKNQRELAKRR